MATSEGGNMANDVVVDESRDKPTIGKWNVHVDE